MVLHHSAASEQRAWRVPLCKQRTGEKMAYFLLSHRISALAHRRVERHFWASLHLRKEHTLCLPYIVSCLASL
jgi:hypothetical protein